jgi:hypothetical protein
VTEIGNTKTTFKYKKSTGEEINNFNSENHFNYSIGYRLTLSEKFYISGNIVLNRYATYASDPVYDNLYKWDTRYLGFGVGFDYDFIKFKKFSFAAKVAVEPQFLINGTQTINNQVHSLKGVEQFDKPFVFLRGGLGINFCADANLAFTARYMYGYGLPMGKPDDGEELHITSSAFSLGLLISINKCDYCYTKHFK